MPKSPQVTFAEGEKRTIHIPAELHRKLSVEAAQVGVQVGAYATRVLNKRGPITDYVDRREVAS